jgi:hypothetical protein
MRTGELIIIWEKVQNKEDSIMAEQRKYPRYFEHLYLKMFVYDPNITPAKVSNFKASTLDVGLGGFRIESPEELTIGSIVGFQSTEDISSHNMSGLGEVRWGKPSNKAEYFEYGIAAFPLLVQSG